jgi:ankyrin repeat protein
MHEAAMCNSPQALQLLHEYGADIHAVDRDGNTPFLLAVIHNSHHAQAALLQLGANYLGMDGFGRSILHYAAVYGDRITYEVLESFGLDGIDINAKSNQRWTARQLFEARQDNTDDSTSAFYRLLEAICSIQANDEAEDHSSNWEEYDSSEQELDSSEEEFLDALEFMSAET